MLLTNLQKHRQNPLLIFILSFFITGLLEYICGVILLNFFHMRLWDYTGYFLNIKGHVCFLSAFAFGIGGLLVTYCLIPVVKKIYKKVNKNILRGILALSSLIFLGDIIASCLK